MTKEQAIKDLKYQEKMRAKDIDYRVNNLVIAEAIEALEKQIAKKIEEHNKTCKCRVFDYMDYECTQRVPYCCVCGQKLDWSEVE